MVIRLVWIGIIFIYRSYRFYCLNCAPCWWSIRRIDNTFRSRSGGSTITVIGCWEIRGASPTIVTRLGRSIIMYIFRKNHFYVLEWILFWWRIRSYNNRNNVVIYLSYRFYCLNCAPCWWSMRRIDNNFRSRYIIGFRGKRGVSPTMVTRLGRNIIMCIFLLILCTISQFCSPFMVLPANMVLLDKIDLSEITPSSLMAEDIWGVILALRFFVICYSRNFSG